MTSWRIVRMFAGIVILVSLALGVYVNTWWLLLTAFVGLNLLQSSVTCWCPLEIILRKFGVEPGC